MRTKEPPSVPINDLLPGSDDSVPPVRIEPVQVRSAARIDTLLDAAAAVVDDTGFDRLTTAMVSERAGASIGTVYRYFPDRIALLQGLRDRAVQRYRVAVIQSIRDEKPEHWWEAVDCGLNAFAQMFRTESGFRIMRFTDAERAGADDEHEYQAGFFAARFAEILSDEFGLPGGEELTFHLSIAVQIGESLVTRAFLVSDGGDERILREARTVVRGYLASYYDVEPVPPADE
jgi:AcrR family transcriptional regulator